jgi:hypothetical protein
VTGAPPPCNIFSPFVVLPVAAKYRMSSVSRFVALETVFTAIQFAIAGVLLALVFNA